MNNLRRIRRQKEFSQYQIAFRAKISQATLSLFERHFREPDIHTKKRLAKALHCSVVEIFPDSDSEASQRNNKS